MVKENQELTSFCEFISFWEYLYRDPLPCFCSDMKNMVNDSIIYHPIIHRLLIFLKAMKSPTAGCGALQGEHG